MFLESAAGCFVADCGFLSYKKREVRPGHPLFVLHLYRLSAETKLLDDISVSLDVNLLQVVKDTTALTDELQAGTTGCEVFLVVFQMLGEVSYTLGK